MAVCWHKYACVPMYTSTQIMQTATANNINFTNLAVRSAPGSGEAVEVIPEIGMGPGAVLTSILYGQNRINHRLLSQENNCQYQK